MTAAEVAFAPIKVSEHALVRARQRLGVESEEEIRRDVRDALLADRLRDDRQPSWLQGDFRIRNGDGIVWSRDRSRIYLVRLGRKLVVVVTALAKCRPGL